MDSKDKLADRVETLIEFYKYNPSRDRTKDILTMYSRLVQLAIEMTDPPIHPDDIDDGDINKRMEWIKEAFIIARNNLHEMLRVEEKQKQRIDNIYNVYDDNKTEMAIMDKYGLYHTSPDTQKRR